MHRLLQNKTQLFFLITAIAFILLAIIGGIREYSPLPFNDMWDGYINWYLGDINHWQSWWHQHNEHRIVLARLIFWLDVTFFQGAGWFLIAINYVLVSLTCLLFWLFLRDYTTTPECRYPARILFLFLVAWLFSWSQRDNLTWGFQNQFFTAQLLPLCAFYFLYRSCVKQTAYPFNFAISCIFGIASFGTMANGILALPLMTFYAFLNRQRWQRIVALLFLSVLMLCLYFYDFERPMHHSSLVESILQHPKLLTKYILTYLGLPFYQIIKSHKILLLAGLLLIVSSVYCAVKAVQPHKHKQLELALLCFILYIGGTALGTGGGRIVFGIEQAFSGRYNTPALMAWAALYVLYFPLIMAGYKRYGNYVWLPFVMLILLITPKQFHTLKNKNALTFPKEIAALALELRVKDKERISSVYPVLAPVFSVVEHAEQRNFPISGMEGVQHLRTTLGTTRVTSSTLSMCTGALETVLVIPEDKQFVRVHGWMLQSPSTSTPQLIQFIDNQKRIVGYALTGERRHDLAKKVNRDALYGGFEGYVMISRHGQLTAVNDTLHCEFNIAQVTT